MFRIAPKFIGFGTYNFMGVQLCDGKNLGWPELPLAHKQDLLRAALKNGINFVDTSDFYGLGSVESLIGDIVGNSDDVIVATKGGKTNSYQNGKITRDFSAAAIRSAIDISRQRLKRDVIDLYQLHGPEKNDLENAAMWEVLAEAQEKGHIDEIGVSLTKNGLRDNAYLDRLCSNSLVNFVQLPVNFLRPETLRAVAVLRTAGKRIISRSSFEHGLLFKQEDFSDLDSADPRRDFLAPDYDLDFSLRVTATREVVQEFLEQHPSLKLTSPQLILLMIKSSKLCDVALFGASKIEHIEQNVAVANMSEPNKETLKDFSERMKRAMAERKQSVDTLSPLAQALSVADRPSKVRPLEVLNKRQVGELRSSLADPFEPRKSGLSINHVIGCPMDCAYCVRHKDGNYHMKQPHMIMSDEEAVQKLLEHPYFIPQVTPLQVFNKATDGFIPSVKPHLFNTLSLLDQEGVANDVLLITRFRVSKEDCDFLNSLSNLRVTLLVTYSGIENKDIEPIPNAVPAQSLKTAFAEADRYRVVLYWRPIVPGLNDSDEQIVFALNDLSEHAHATVFTGLFYGDEVRQFFIDNDLPSLASDFARRKIFPEQLEERILSHVPGSAADGKVFRKTSCAVSFVHGRPDYNGHYGIVNDGVRELCGICPSSQLDICAANHKTPSENDIRKMAGLIGHANLRFTIEPERAIIVEHMDTESVRYFLQHSFQFQFHDEQYAHRPKHHGRADIGWPKKKSRKEHKP